MNDQRPIMREFSPVSYELAKNDLERDRAEHDRLIARRDALKDKLRAGLVTLNAGSLLALLASLNGEGSAASWVGIDASNAKWIATCFVCGLFAAGASYHVADYGISSELSDSIPKVRSAEHRVALYEKPACVETNDELREALEDYAKIPLVGFRVSIAHIVTLGLAQAFWTAGIVLPLAKTLTQ